MNIAITNDQIQSDLNRTDTPWKKHQTAILKRACWVAHKEC